MQQDTPVQIRLYCSPSEPSVLLAQGAVTNSLCPGHSLIPKGPIRAEPGHSSLGDTAHSMLGLSFSTWATRGPSSSHYTMKSPACCLLCAGSQPAQRPSWGGEHGGKGASVPRVGEQAGPPCGRGSSQPRARGTQQGCKPHAQTSPCAHMDSNVPETAPSSHSDFPSDACVLG